MTTMTFDTLKFANRLKAAGVPDKQAEARAEALAEVFEVNLKELVAKEDLVTKEDLHRELLHLEQRMTIRLGAMLVVAVGIVAVLVKLL